MSLEPLRLYEVGAYGELMARPNPDKFIVRQMPKFEQMLPHLEAQRGRKLTPAEIERERNSAPSMVLTAQQSAELDQYDDNWPFGRH